MKKSTTQSNNNQHPTASFARRALLLLTFLVACVGNVWGQEYERYPLEKSGNNGNNPLQPYYDFNNYNAYGNNGFVEFRFKVTYNVNTGNQLGELTNKYWGPKYGIYPDGPVSSGDPIIKTYTISELNNLAGNTGGIQFNLWNDVTLEEAYILIPIEDSFLNTAKNGVVPVFGASDSMDKEKDASGTLTLSDIKKDIENLSDIKYARIYVTDANGTQLEYNTNNLLQVNGGQQAGESAKNGVYVYNNGGVLDLGSITATLNAGVGNLNKYRIVVLLSTLPAESADGSGNVTKEPQWDHEYIYRFTYLARNNFEAVNINDVRTKYKTVVYDNSSNSRQAIIRLFGNWHEVTGDCNVSKSDFKDAYARWYLTDADGNVIPGIESLAAPDGYQRIEGTNYGYYRQGFDPTKFREGNPTTGSGLWGNGDDWNWDYQGYNPTIKLTSEANNNYENVRLVCVVTTWLDEMNMPDQEPEMMQVKYVYTLKTKTDLEGAPFVHYIGESHRDYLTPSEATGAMYSWNYTTGKVEAADNGSIRQDVHQTDYYVYIDPSKEDDNNNQLLILPIEHWASFTPENDGNKRTSTEPLAYYRWYDWYSDKKSDYLEIYNDNGKSVLEEKEYGLIAMMLDGSSVTPYCQEVGVKLNSAGLNVLKTLAEGKEITIACDVSRYMDGIVLDGLGWNNGLDGDARAGQGYTDKYLVHEPTLSMRYVFHILPAKRIADDIDAAATALNKVVEGNALNDEERSKVFQIYEDNGWVVVPLSGKFSLRVDLQDLNQYFINNNNTPVQCNNLQWYCYYEDENGDLWKKNVDMRGRNTLRLAKYEASEFSGDYVKVGSTTDTKNIEVGNAMQLHLVGYLGNGIVGQPVIHYGLEFTNESPVEITDIKEAQKNYLNNVSNQWSYRTDAYMYEHLTHGSTLNFDDFFTEATRYDKPITSYDNYADAPMIFKNAQYGYCYPQLYGLCASTWQIYHGAWWNGYGFAPTHSDYTLLKSMNVQGVSASETYNNQSFYTYWYDPGNQPLYDITHEWSSGKEYDNSKYGTYLYIDAADEARTIAHLEFDAALCANSEIFYTAYVANMTPLTSTPPQVMFRVSTDVEDETTGETKRIPVVSFLTGDIQSQGANQTAVWYQVYGSTKIPKELEHIVNGEPRRYYVAIDNYCEDTKGADYTIDQISFFTTTAKVQILQSSTPCDESSGIEVAILAKANDLNDYAHDGEELYYRIFKKNSEGVFAVADAVVGDGIYKGGDGSHYGSVKFFQNTMEVKDAKSSLGPDETGYYYNDAEWYFQFDRREFDLDVDATYFVSFYSSVSATPPTDEDNTTLRGWGNPYSGGACETMYSNDITPRILRIDFKEPDDSDYEGTVRIPCDVSGAVKNFTITVQYPTPNGGYSANTVLFDYYIGAKKDFKAIKNASGLYLEKALERFRANYPEGEYTAYNLPKPVAGSEYEDGKEYTKEMYDLIMEHIDDLRLFATSEFNYTFTAAGEYRFAAIPVVRETPDGDICSPLEFVFDVEKAAGGPQLALGFSDVDYKGHGDTRVIRIGLEQLDNVKARSGTYTLHIPVHSFEYKNKDKSDNSIVFYGNDLVLWSTDDPTNTISEDKPVVATLQDDAGNKRPIVNRDHQYIAVKFNDDFTFHEGYQYELHTVYYDLGDDEDGTPSTEACATHDLTFIIKVVPKYVTWNDGEKAEHMTENKNINTNWNNDGNWSRSTKTELYSSSYQNNTEIDNRLTSTPATFVPMKFTYVTIPTKNKAPKLVNLTRGTTSGVDNGIYTNIGSDATANIQYDMMVRYSLDPNDGQDKCIDHGIDGNVYDCEKFYGNWAKEIYFKPEAELVNQHYLTYEKVWVEKKLTAGQWTLMSTPLQNTYAGDMYVPFADGQQATEAFQPIEFNTTTYSRTKYPIYQRSWQQEGSKVYTKANDVRATKYNAELKGSVDETLTQWSHTYNDVWVDYSKWKGFAIRAHKSDYSGAPNALLRLPKADDEYDYYDWNDGNGEQPTPPANALSRSNSGKLFTDASAAVNGVTYGVAYGSSQGRTAGDGNVSEVASVVQNADNYVLVGNPYLCSIDMSKFLEVNYKEDGTGSLATNGYWTYENSTMKAGAAGEVVNPLQAFFVKAKADASEIKFTADMMTDGNSQTNNGSRTFALTAANDRGRSTATVTVGEETRSVETLFDSNLADVPMVYTVADGQAVSINQVTGLDRPIAFGVTCTTSDEPVAVTFSDIEQLTSGEVYVVDAVTGEQTLVGEGGTLTVQPNDYGRYFLLAGTLGIREQVDVQQGIVVSVRGRVVTVTSGEVLTAVRAVAADGTTVYQTTGGGTTTSFTLATPGVYIIKAENVAGEQQTVKVVVK